MLASRSPSSMKAARLFVLFLLALALPAGAEGQTRVALLIGNANYQNARLPDLPNAAHDAAALAHELETLGFTVMEATDVTAANLLKLLSKAEAEQSSEAVLFFYAGHAVASGGETYLLPTDAPDPTNFAQLTSNATRLGALTARFAKPRRAFLMFLDACRDGPAAETGSSRPQALQGDNVFLAFASQPGEAANDGAEGNSPFARALLQAMAIPGLDLNGVMARVEEETERLTLGRQIPWSRSTLRKPFVFKAAGAATPPGG